MEEPGSGDSIPNSGILPVLAEIKRRLENVCKDKIVDIIPFGIERSKNLESVDAAIVLKEEEEIGNSVKRISRVLEEVLKEKKIRVRFISQEKLEKAMWPLYIQRRSVRRAQ